MKSIIKNDMSFTILKYIGKGKEGYAFLVSDKEKEYVIKMIHHEKTNCYTPDDKLASEVAAYKRLSEIGIRMPKLLSVDIEK